MDCSSLNTPVETSLNYEYFNIDENCNVPCRIVMACLILLKIYTRLNLGISGNLCSKYVNENIK